MKITEDRHRRVATQSLRTCERDLLRYGTPRTLSRTDVLGHGLNETDNPIVCCFPDFNRVTADSSSERANDSFESIMNNEYVYLSYALVLYTFVEVETRKIEEHSKIIRLNKASLQVRSSNFDHEDHCLNSPCACCHHQCLHGIISIGSLLCSRP